MKKKSFEEIMEEAIKELVEEIHPEDISEDDVSDGTKEKIERDLGTQADMMVRKEGNH